MPPNKPSKRPVGRPTNQDPAERRARALDNLQRSVDRTCAAIFDCSTSYAIRARRAAKAGVPQETVTKGLAAIRAALNDLEAAVPGFYSENGSTKVQTSRVSLND